MISSLLPTTVRNGYFQKRYEQVQYGLKRFQESHEGVPGKELRVQKKLKDVRKDVKGLYQERNELVPGKERITRRKRNSKKGNERT
jgi:hypothetical protein